MFLGNASESNCGVAFKAAEPNFVEGAFRGCEQKNPNVEPEVPAVLPVCVPGSSQAFGGNICTKKQGSRHRYVISNTDG